MARDAYGLLFLQVAAEGSLAVCPSDLPGGVSCYELSDLVTPQGRQEAQLIRLQATETKFNMFKDLGRSLYLLLTSCI